MAFVRAVFHPYPALQIHIGFVQTVGYGNHYEDALIGNDVLRQRVDGRAYVVGCGVAELLVELAYLIGGQADDLAIVSNPDKNAATAIIGEGGQLCCETVQA